MLPDLTIVVASVESQRRIAAALDSLRVAASGLRAETVVVDASADNSAALAERFAGVRVERHPAGTLVPMLWARGIQLARGRVVATTTAHTVVGRRWAEALVNALDDPGVGGVGGPMRLSSSASAVDAAVFFLRYSTFLPARMPDGPVAGEIAGDNAAYRRADLVADPATLRGGFWELPFHVRLRQSGRTLVARREAVAEFGDAFPFRVIAAHRYRHGREFGATRVSTGARARWQVIAAAPLVPGLLACRATARAMGDASHRSRVATALPPLLALGGAWAAGEAVGAWTVGRSGPGAGR